MNTSQALAKRNTFEYIRTFSLDRWKINIYRKKREDRQYIRTENRSTIQRTMDENFVINSMR